MNHDDPLHELARALNITPSPEFAARVRERVAGQHPRKSWWAFRYAMVAAAVPVAVATVLMVRPDMEPASELTPGATAAATSPAAPPQVAAVAPVAAGQAARPVRMSEVAPATVFGEVLVPSDERVALERLVAAIRAGRTTVPAGRRDEVLDEQGLWVPRAISVEPLKLELLAGTPVDPNKEQIK